MTHKGLAPYDVVGSFADLHAAQEAMTRIGRSGIEAGRVSLVGEPVREAAADLDTSDRDGNVVDSVGKRMFTGMAAGGVVGGAVGLLAGAALGAPEIGAAAAGIAAGGAVGGMTSGVASIDLGDDWELTHESDVAGRGAGGRSGRLPGGGGQGGRRPRRRRCRRGPLPRRRRSTHVEACSSIRLHRKVLVSRSTASPPSRRSARF